MSCQHQCSSSFTFLSDSLPFIRDIMWQFSGVGQRINFETRGKRHTLVARSGRVLETTELVKKGKTNDEWGQGRKEGGGCVLMRKKNERRESDFLGRIEKGARLEENWERHENVREGPFLTYSGLFSEGGTPMTNEWSVLEKNEF